MKGVVKTIIEECKEAARTVIVCPLAFGEVGVKSRVKSVLNYKKPTFLIITLAFICCVVLAICFLTEPEKDNEANYYIENITVNDLPVSLEVKNVSATGLKLKCRVDKDDDTFGMHSAANDYYLEKYDNGWHELDTLTYAYVSNISPIGENMEWEFDWTELYGELETGEYRIAKPIWYSKDVVSSSFGNEYIFYVPFNVYNADKPAPSLTEAGNRLVRTFEMNESGEPIYSDEYAGCYIDGGKMVILLTDISDEITTKYKDILGNCAGYAVFEKTEYSYNYLWSEVNRLSELIRDNNLTWYTCGVREKENGIQFDVKEEDYEAIKRLLEVEGEGVSIEIDISSAPVTVNEF